MTDIERDSELGDALSDALEAALSARGLYLGIVAVGVVLSAIWFAHYLAEPLDDSRGYVATALPGLLGWMFARHQFSSRLSENVIPVILSAMFGMTYRPKAHATDIHVLEELGLLPKNGGKQPQAEAIGRTEEGLFLRVWGVTTTSRRHRSYASYSAYVCEFDGKTEWQGLTLAPEDLPRWLRSALPNARTAPVVHPPLRRLPSLRLVRTADDAPHVEDLSGRVDASNRLFQDQAAFAGVHFGPDRTWMVIQDTTLPMRIFGLFKSRDAIVADLSERLKELSIPLRLAEIWELNSS